MTFTQTTDMAAVERILAEPRCYRRMVNDSAPRLEEFKVSGKGGFISVLAYEGSEAVAAFLLFLMAPGFAEVHFCFVPQVWGRAREIAKEFLAWVWRCSSISVLFGPVPSYNRLALKLANSVGFEEYDIEVGAVTKNGKLYDRILTKAVRPNAAV